MKRMLCAALCLCLLFSGAAAEEESVPETEGGPRAIEQRTYTLYLGRLDSAWPEPFPLYFVDGTNDLPFLDLRDFAALLNWFFPSLDASRRQDYHIAVNVEEGSKQASLERENGSGLTFDFALGRMIWSDYSAFRADGDDLSFDLLRSFRTQDAKGRPYLLAQVFVRERSGGQITVNLSDYGIPMIAQDGLYLVPMQTLAAFCLSAEGVSLYFNHRCLILCSPRQMTPPYGRVLSLLSDDWGTLSAAFATGTDILPGSSLLKTYMAGPKGGRSRALADFGYRELCLELDHFYGLKDSLSAADFSAFCRQAGLTEELTSRDPAAADGAIKRLTETWLDDGHSVFFNGSYRAKTSQNDAVPGAAAAARLELLERLSALRGQYPGAARGYYEIGHTAFITLDHFAYASGVDYYEAARKNALPDDAVGRVIRAHAAITRENSPIQNVVLDLSLNTGGAVPAALYTLAWFTGSAPLSMRDTFSGAEAAAGFLADVNLDRRFNAADTLSGRDLKLYCLISPVSFSCGNLVPWAFKADGGVTLLGGETGGGGCALWPMTTAWGASYAISGPYRLSFLKRGAFSEGERGAKPDHALPSYEYYCDREALAAFIEGL